MRGVRAGLVLMISIASGGCAMKVEKRLLAGVA
jgi:hypothetical protein